MADARKGKKTVGQGQTRPQPALPVRRVLVPAPKGQSVVPAQPELSVGGRTTVIAAPHQLMKVAYYCAKCHRTREVSFNPTPQIPEEMRLTCGRQVMVRKDHVWLHCMYRRKA